MDRQHAASNAIDEDEARSAGDVARRTALMGFGALGAAGLLAACGDDGSGSGTGTSGEPGETSAPGETGESTETAAPEDGDNGAQTVATTSDVPVGGGVVVNAHSMVIVQPAAGEFRAFSSICTHQGCAVTKVADGTITCPCHGSQFSATDGSVQTGPATAPLPEVAISIDGTDIFTSE